MTFLSTCPTLIYFCLNLNFLSFLKAVFFALPPTSFRVVSITFLLSSPWSIKTSPLDLFFHMKPFSFNSDTFASLRLLPFSLSMFPFHSHIWEYELKRHTDIVSWLRSWLTDLHLKQWCLDLQDHPLVSGKYQVFLNAFMLNPLETCKALFEVYAVMKCLFLVISLKFLPQSNSHMFSVRKTMPYQVCCSYIFLFNLQILYRSTSWF